MGTSIFGDDLALLAVVHLDPLPGSSRYAGDLNRVVDKAVADARLYAAHGAHAVIIENLGDAPYFVQTEAPETVAAMTLAAAEIRRVVDVPLGINVLRNSWKAALAVAAAVGADFIRLNVLTDAIVADQGIIVGEAAAVARYRRSIGADDVKIFADIYSKHATPLARRPLRVVAQDMVRRGGADAIIVSGLDSWQPPSREDIDEIREAAPSTPIIIGSGLVGSVVDLLGAVDGLIYAFVALRPGATAESARRDATNAGWTPPAGETEGLLDRLSTVAAASRAAGEPSVW